MTKKERKLDIFKLLASIDQKNKNHYHTLTEEELKEFSPYVIMRWLTGTSNIRNVYFINEIVNPYIFDGTMRKHPELLYDLMLICTTGSRQRYKWSMPKKEIAYPLITNLICEYFNFSKDHAKVVMPNLTEEDLLSYADQLAYQKEEIRDLKKEIKKRDRL